MNWVQHHDLLFELPNGWSDLTQVLIAGGPDQGFRPTLVVTREPIVGLMSLDEFAERQVAKLSNYVRDFTLVRREAKTRFGDQHGALTEFSGTYEGKRLRQLQFLFFHNRTAYAVTATHADALFDGVRAQFERVFASLKLAAMQEA